MSNTKSRNSGWLMTLAGIGILLVLLVLVNFVVSEVNVRADMTADHLYTLSSGSKKILANLKSPVTIRFYYSQDAENVPVALKSYAKRVEDLLAEYKRAANGKLKVSKLNPKPDSDEEDSAVLDGVEGKQLNSYDKFYLGIAVNCVDQTEALPFLNPGDENNLEYNITRAIYRVTNPHKTVVGVMSSQPVMGQKPNPMMMMQRSQSQDPWMFITEMKKDCDVREVPTTVQAIDDDIDVLVLHHAKDLSAATQYAIDQFIMRGGRLIAFMDPFSEFEQQMNANPMMRQPPGSSSLPKLLSAWGLTFDTNKVVVDTNFATTIPDRNGGEDEMHPSVLSLDHRAVNPDDPVTNSLKRLIMADAGAITGTPVAGLKETVLLHTTDQGYLVDKYEVMQKGRPGYGRQLVAKLKKGDAKVYDLAVRLDGTFKTAFPDGPPPPPADKDKNGDEPTTPPDASKQIKETAKPGSVILVGDSDILVDGFWIQKMNVLGQQMYQVTSNNDDFLQNSIDQLSGDSSLISIRSRGITNRPFEKVAELQRAAEEKWAAEEESLNKELQEIQQNINTLMRTKKGQGNQVIFSPEVQKELEAAKKKKVDASKRLKEVRKEYRRDVDSLETFLTWANIALVPFLIAHFGLILAVFRRYRKTSQ